MYKDICPICNKVYIKTALNQQQCGNLRCKLVMTGRVARQKEKVNVGRPRREFMPYKD